MFKLLILVAAVLIFAACESANAPDPTAEPSYEPCAVEPPREWHSNYTWTLADGPPLPPVLPGETVTFTATVRDVPGYPSEVATWGSTLFPGTDYLANVACDSSSASLTESVDAKFVNTTRTTAEISVTNNAPVPAYITYFIARGARMPLLETVGVLDLTGQDAPAGTDFREWAQGKMFDEAEALRINAMELMAQDPDVFGPLRDPEEGFTIWTQETKEDGELHLIGKLVYADCDPSYTECRDTEFDWRGR